MSHEITPSDNFAHVGKAAWHGLGVKIEDGSTATDTMADLGMAWDSELVPMHYTKMDENGVEEVAVDNRFLQIRKDNGGQLGIVGKGYNILQNKELATFTDTLIKASEGSGLETCGTLFTGRQVYTLIKLDETREIVKGDPVDPYLLINNTHGGKGSFHAFPTAIRVVCANTLRFAHTRDGASGISFAHVGKSWTQQLDLAQKTLIRAKDGMDKFFHAGEALSQIQFTSKSVQAYFDKCWDVAFGGRYGGDKGAKLAAREKMTGEWTELLDHEWNNIAGIGGTMWSAMNAVTQWSDHERGSFGSVTEDTRRKDSNLFGSSHKLKAAAYNKALALV